MPVKVIKKNTRKIILFLKFKFWKKRKGIQKKVIETKLSPYVPIKDNICIDSIDHNQVYEIKFQGKPVNILPLKNSNTEKTKEKSKIKYIFFSVKEPMIKIAIPKNKDKNSGINIRAKGINPVNVSSWVNDIEIQ